MDKLTITTEALDAAMNKTARELDAADRRAPNLLAFDWILVNSSAGKDSQAMLDVVAEQARRQGVMDRVVVVHCDLGRVEWEGTRDLAEEQAAFYGFRFEVVSRPQGDLLDHVEKRGMWPSPAARYCTSDHKRGQVSRLLTALAKESREAGVPRARILNAMGFRSEESAARKKKIGHEFEIDKRATNGRREVTTWLPILDWTVEQVWDRIRAAGTRHHPAYDLGMPRLSCCFCIMAGRDALMIAAEHNPKLLDQYVEVEDRIGHKFTQKLSIRDIRDAVQNGERVKKAETWSA